MVETVKQLHSRNTNRHHPKWNDKKATITAKPDKAKRGPTGRGEAIEKKSGLVPVSTEGLEAAVATSCDKEKV